MRRHLKILRKYEEDNSRLEKLCDYIENKTSSLVKQYRDGSVNLPSFILIKQLQARYRDLCTSDKELDDLFAKAVNCSKLFYSRLVSAIESSQDDLKFFEKEFNRKIQPLGQKLINFLVNIKFRIRFLNSRLKHDPAKNKISNIFKKLFIIPKTLSRASSNALYSLIVFRSKKYHLVKRLYYTAILLSSVSLFMLNFMIKSNLSSKALFLLDTLLIALIAFASAAFYPGGDFNKIDIHGKNLVAHKYKLFFSRDYDKKILDIFALQNASEYGHNLDSLIESEELKIIN